MRMVICLISPMIISCFFSNYNRWYIPWYQWDPLWHEINDIPYEAWFLISILLLKSKKIWGTPQWCLGHMAEEKGTRGDGSLGKHRTRRASGVDVVTPKNIKKLWFATILGGFWLLIWLISFFGLAPNRCYGGMWQVKALGFDRSAYQWMSCCCHVFKTKMRCQAFLL